MESPRAYRVVRVDPDESPAEEHRWVLDYWREKKGSRIAPTWKDIQLSDFPPRVIPWTIVVDIDRDERSIRYRFWGTQLAEYYGRDYTGRSPLDIGPDEYGRTVYDAYMDTVDNKRPNLDVREYMARNERIGVQAVLRLPISDDGTNVDKALAVALFDISRHGRAVRDVLARIDESD